MISWSVRDNLPTLGRRTSAASGSWFTWYFLDRFFIWSTFEYLLSMLLESRWLYEDEERELTVSNKSARLHIRPGESKTLSAVWCSKKSNFQLSLWAFLTALSGIESVAVAGVAATVIVVTVLIGASDLRRWLRFCDCETAAFACKNAFSLPIMETFQELLQNRHHSYIAASLRLSITTVRFGHQRLIAKLLTLALSP